VAYLSDGEVYVRPFPGPGGKWQISSGATENDSGPRWRRDGKEISYVSSKGELMSVPVQTGPVFRAGVPRPLFELRNADYDVEPGGQRFLVSVPIQTQESLPINVVVNWTSEIPHAK
jgi:hypothetical protein